MLNLQGERLADIVLTPPEENRRRAAMPIEPSLEVRALSFRYSDTEPFVLLNCSFTVRRASRSRSSARRAAARPRS
jgi:ATP-binding cassette subfamily B protein RaxB